MTTRSVPRQVRGRRRVPALVRVLGVVMGGAAAMVCVAARCGAAPMPMPTPAPGRVIVGGRLDRGFGAGGHAVVPTRLEATFEGVAVQSDGAVVVVGNGGVTGDDGLVREVGIVLLRFTADGLIDDRFGDGGMVLLRFPDRRIRYATALAVARDDAIVVVGRALDGPGGADVTVVRCTRDGMVDATFGVGGVVTTDLVAYDGGASVVVQSNGRIVVAALSNSPAGASTARGTAALLGYASDGGLDPTFGTGGVALLDAFAPDAAARATLREGRDASLVLAASSPRSNETETAVVRFDHDGHELRLFDAVGLFVKSIAVAPDGSVVATGVVQASDDPPDPGPVLVRWRADGALDPTFGVNGIRDVDERAGVGAAIVVDAQGRLVLAGALLLRRTPDGTADASFGRDGEAEAEALEELADAVLQPDGKIVAAGGGYRRGGPNGAIASGILARYESDASRLCGDADASETLTVSDGVAVLRASADLGGPCATLVCDLDGDGAISVTDGVATLRAAAGLPNTMRCGAR